MNDDCSTSSDHNDDSKEIGDEKEIDQILHEIHEIQQKEDEIEKTLNVIGWFEYPGLPGKYYDKCFGHQSYVYAKPNDVILAYGYKYMDKEWFQWQLSQLGLTFNNVIWVDTNDDGRLYVTELLDKKRKSCVDYLVQKLSASLTVGGYDKIALKFFYLADGIEEIVDYIRKEISGKANVNPSKIIHYSMPREWHLQFGNKACLHRYYRSYKDTKSLFEQKGIYDIDGLSVCRGYVCGSKDELLKAYKLLTHEIGYPNVVVKDVYGVGGDDILFYESFEDLKQNFEWKACGSLGAKWFNLEEDLRYDPITKKKLKSGSLEFIGQSFDMGMPNGIFKPYLQFIADDHIYTGGCPYTNEKNANRIMKISEQVCKMIGLNVMGGYDFCVQHRGNNQEARIVLIDMNTNRYCGTQLALTLQRKLKLEDKFYLREQIKLSSECTFKRLQSDCSDWLFNSTKKSGCFFHAFSPITNIAIITIIGEDSDDVNGIYDKINALSWVVSK